MAHTAPRSQRTRARALLAAATLVALAGALPGRAQEAVPTPADAGRPGAPAPDPAASPEPATPPAQRRIEISEYLVEGSTALSDADLEKALEPFLGPGHVLEDVERARAALERTYGELGYQSVSVSIPPQTVRGGSVRLKVTEGRIARLRVIGATAFLPSQIRRLAPSLAEGSVPNFNAIVRDIVALNQIPDRQVTPALRAGTVPGTIEVDLNVRDRLPLHASLEFNNRSSAGTSPTRLNGSLRYENLWQLGHGLTFGFQVAPGRPKDGLVLSAAYLFRFADRPRFTLGLSGTYQDSDVSTVGDIAVAGKGRSAGVRANFQLPATEGFFQTLSVGLDYKLYLENLRLGADRQKNPVHYWPFSLQYVASWFRDGAATTLTASALLSLRPISGSTELFDAKRYGASAGFALLRLGLERFDDLPLGLQLLERSQGQLSPAPLVGSEQIIIGGADTVRGYPEAQAAGDQGVSAGVELRSPSLLAPFGARDANWLRLHAFTDAGLAAIHSPLPEQKREFALASWGGGARLELYAMFRASAEVGVPLRSEGTTPKGTPRFLFRVAGDF